MYKTTTILDPDRVFMKTKKEKTVSNKRTRVWDLLESEETCERQRGPLCTSSGPLSGGS